MNFLCLNFTFTRPKTLLINISTCLIYLHLHPPERVFQTLLMGSMFIIRPVKQVLDFLPLQNWFTNAILSRRILTVLEFFSRDVSIHQTKNTVMIETKGNTVCRGLRSVQSLLAKTRRKIQTYLLSKAETS